MCLDCPHCSCLVLDSASWLCVIVVCCALRVVVRCVLRLAVVDYVRMCVCALLVLFYRG